MISDRNDSAHTWWLGTPLSYISAFSDTVSFVE
jgi:hypothetical protein